jgi:hypothetical protein
MEQSKKDKNKRNMNLENEILQICFDVLEKEMTPLEAQKEILRLLIVVGALGEQLSDVSCWRFIKGEQNEVNLIEMPKNENFEMLFDNGSICEFYDDDMPFAEVIAWRHISFS